MSINIYLRALLHSKQVATATFLAVMLLGLISSGVTAQEVSVAHAVSTAVLDPATTTVAILPCIDRTGDKEQDWRSRQAAAGYRNLVELFAERGFKIVERSVVVKGIEDSKVDLSDEEEFRRENFYKIGRLVKADIVVFAVIVSTVEDKKPQMPFRNAEIQGRATVKTWVVDVKNERKILSADVKEGKAAGKSKLFGNNEGRWRRVNAVGNALKEQLEEGFLKPLPKVKNIKVNEDGSIPQ